MLVIIQAVADDEGIRHLKAGVVGMDVGLAAGGLVHQRGDGDGGGTPYHEVLLEIAQRHAGIEDILDNNDMAASISSLRSLVIFTAPVELVPL